MKIFILDDEQQIVDNLSCIIREKYSDCEVTTALSFDEMKAKAVDGFDFAFIDIALGERNGPECAIYLKNLFDDIRIIYISGFLDRVPEIFSVCPVYGFLDKPLKKELVYYYIDKIISERYSIIEISSGHKKLQIKASEIMYLESKAKKIRIRCKNKEYFTLGKLNELKTKFPDNFISCHKSFLVNVDFVTDVKEEGFLLNNGEFVPISRSRKKDAVRDFYLRKGNSK